MYTYNIIYTCTSGSFSCRLGSQLFGQGCSTSGHSVSKCICKKNLVLMKSTKVQTLGARVRIMDNDHARVIDVYRSLMCNGKYVDILPYTLVVGCK